MKRNRSQFSTRSVIGLACKCLVGWAVLTASFAAAAEAGFPNKPLVLIVPQAAGGTGDAVSRIVARKLAARLGQAVIVENKPGAGGVVGSSIVAKARPDGYLLVLASTGSATWSIMYPRMNFDPATELAPVAMMGRLPFAVLVRSDSPYRTLAEFVAYAKANPGKVNYASAGLGAVSHLLAAWLGAEAGIDLTHVPYNGTAPAMSALLGGQVDIYLDPVATSLQQVRSGKLRVLATTGGTRSMVMPDVPTIAESGYQVRGTVWLALMTTGGTPAPVIERLNKEIRAVLEDTELRQTLHTLGVEVDVMTPAQFGTFAASEMRTWTKLVRDNGIKSQ